MFAHVLYKPQEPFIHLQNISIVIKSLQGQHSNFRVVPNILNKVLFKDKYFCDAILRTTLFGGSYKNNCSVYISTVKDTVLFFSIILHFVIK